MKIAYIVPSLANQGPVVVVRDLCEVFTARGHECAVFYFDDNVELDFPCPTRRIGERERLDFEAFDVVHSHGLRPDRYVCRYRERGGRVRYVTTLHNYVIADLGALYNPLVGFAAGNLWMWWLRRHDVVVALSRHAMRYYRRWFAARKLTWAYNTRVVDASRGLSKEESDELARFKGGAPLIGMNAGLIRRKRVDRMVEAMAGLPECRLFLVGDGPERRRLEALAERLNVAERVFFAGYRPAAFRYLAHYDAMALTSSSEGFPLALLEAAACSVPAVCTDLPIVKECFDEGEVCFFDAGRPDTLVAATRKALASTGARINARYVADYSPERFYERYSEIYSARKNPAHGE